MNRIEMEEITGQWISLWNVPTDWELFDQLHAENFEDCSPAGRPTDKKTYAAALKEFISIFPDLTIQVDDLIVDESRQRVAVRWSASGTNRLPFMGSGPTHRLTRMKGIEIIELKDGYLTKRWGEWDISDHHEP